MTTIYLVRHAMSQSNIDGCFCGITDVPLAKAGYAQLDYLAERFAEIHIDRVYSSPLMRAAETAKAVNRHHRLDIILRYELHEIDVGDLEGLGCEELIRRYPDEMKRYIQDPGSFSPDGGESMAQVTERAVGAVRRIVEENPGREIALVSHGDFIRAYTCAALGKPLSGMKDMKYNYNTGITRVDFDDELRPKVVFINDASHLPERQTTLLDQYVNE